MQVLPPSGNGKHPAPRSARGAVVLRGAPPPERPATRFPDPLPGGGGWDGLLFTLGRGTIFGFTLMRVLGFVVVLTAVTWALRPLWGGGWVALALLGGLGIVALARMAAARRNFVRFDEEDGTAPTAAPLGVPEKLPIYLWGNLEVQGRVRSFAALPSFYRTFATREHALIGLVQAPSRMGVSRLPDLDAGLWYAFCRPEQMIALRSGSAAWGTKRYPALALTYSAARALPNGRAQQSVETIYIAAREEETVRRLWSDLAVEQSAAQVRNRHAAPHDESK